MTDDDPAADQLDKIDFEAASSLEDSALAATCPDDDGPTVPHYTDPEWSEYVLQQFSEDELIDGRPTAAGLRRVAQILLGDILESRPHTVQAPTPENGGRATVEWHIKFLWGGQDGLSTERIFGDVADVDPGNCDAEFARFATATAATRAEVRALRKALGLAKVVAAEEITNVPVYEEPANGDITETQIRWIDATCKRNDINVLAYLQSGKVKFGAIEDVPFVMAKKIVAHLSLWQRQQDNIPSSVKGYEPDWRATKE